jgi:hypothetical protein
LTLPIAKEGVLKLRFVLYTDKSVSQCMTALNARMQAKASGSRGALDGWVEKNGRFSLSTSSTVARRFRRKTHLQATATRDDGFTVIRGYVPDGVSREGQAVIYGALLLVGVVMVASGFLLPALIAVFATGALYIPLTGDRTNSSVLLGEVQRTLGAKASPPKKTARAGSDQSPVSRPSKSRERMRG